MNRIAFLALALPVGGVSRPAFAEAKPTGEQLEKLGQVAPKIHLPKLIAHREAKLERIYQAKLAAAEAGRRSLRWSRICINRGCEFIN